MANRASNDLVPTGGDPVHDQGLALLEAAVRYIGDETRPRVTQKIGVTRIHRRLDDTFTDQFNVLLGTFTCQQHSTGRFGLGTVSLSTTVIHGVAGIDVNYLAAAVISSSVIACANPAIKSVLIFL